MSKAPAAAHPSQRTSSYLPALPSTKKVAIVAALVIITGLAVYMAAYRPDLAYKMLSWKVAGGVALAGVVTLLVVAIVNERKNAPLRRISERKASVEEVNQFFSSQSYADVEKAFATKQDIWKKTGTPFIDASNASILIHKFGKDPEWRKAMVKGIGSDYERMCDLVIRRRLFNLEGEIVLTLKEQKWHEVLVKDFGNDKKIFIVLDRLNHAELKEFCANIISTLRDQQQLMPLFKQDWAGSSFFQYLLEDELDYLFVQELEKAEGVIFAGFVGHVPFLIDFYLKQWFEKHVNDLKTLDAAIDSFDEIFKRIARLSEGPKQFFAMAALIKELDDYFIKFAENFSEDEKIDLMHSIFEKLECYFNLSKQSAFLNHNDIHIPFRCVGGPLMAISTLRFAKGIEKYKDDWQELLNAFIYHDKEKKLTTCFLKDLSET